MGLELTIEHVRTGNTKLDSSIDRLFQTDTTALDPELRDELNRFKFLWHHPEMRGKVPCEAVHRASMDLGIGEQVSFVRNQIFLNFDYLKTIPESGMRMMRLFELMPRDLRFPAAYVLNQLLCLAQDTAESETLLRSAKFQDISYNTSTFFRILQKAKDVNECFRYLADKRFMGVEITTRIMNTVLGKAQSDTEFHSALSHERFHGLSVTKGTRRLLKNRRINLDQHD